MLLQRNKTLSVNNPTVLLVNSSQKIDNSGAVPVTMANGPKNIVAGHDGAVVNLAADPRFTAIGPSSYWDIYSGATASVVTDQSPPFGTTAAKVVTSSVSHGVATTAANFTSAVAGEQYSFSTYVKGAGIFRLLVEVYNAGGSVFSYLNLPQKAITATWSRYSGTVTMPANTAKFRLMLLQYQAGPITMYLANTQLEKGNVVHPYFDGYSGAGYFWTGTANVSPSGRIASYEVEPAFYLEEDTINYTRNPRAAIDLTSWGVTSGAAPTRVVGGFTNPISGVVFDCVQAITGSSGYDGLFSNTLLTASGAPLTPPRTFTGSAWVKVPAGQNA